MGGQASFSQEVVDIKGNQIYIEDKVLGPFSNIVNSRTNQDEMYESVIPPFIDSFINGINCTIFMYGQTGSGKTHTLFGPPSFFKKDYAEYGICPKFFAHMVNLAQQDSSLKFTASAIELYFNDCNDLLNEKKKIPIAGQTKSKGTSFRQGAHTGGINAQYDEKGKWIPPNIVESQFSKENAYEAKGQEEVELNSPQDVIRVMELVEISRSCKGHQINHRSSRSHCIVQLNCTRKKGNSVVKSKFLFVDLAGSERIAKSGATNLRAEEAKTVNQSLTTLGRCILAIKKKEIPPFRESSLTMLLKDSLCGKSKTCIFCTVADEPDMVLESISTLRFGESCGHVKLKVQQQQSTNLSNEVARLTKAVEVINLELQEMRDKGWNG
jgi:kinesin family protein 11